MAGSPTFYAYIHCRPDGRPFYVGKGCDGRAFKMIRRNSYHNNIVAKYGSENILVGILTCSSEDISFELEKGIIKCLRRSGIKLANMTEGGEGVSGYKHSEDVKIRLRKLTTGRRHTEDWKKSMSAIMQGENHPMYGKTQPKSVWINDGSINRRVLKTDLLPEGFVYGRIGGWEWREESKVRFASKLIGNKNGLNGKSTSGCFWITNGTENKMVRSRDIPEGWRFGRTYSRKK